MKIGFILNISLKKPGPSVHLLEDIIETVRDHQVIVIQKTFDNSVHEVINNRKDYYVAVKKNKKWNLIKRYLDDIIYAKMVKKLILSNRMEFDTIFIQSSPVAYFTVKALKKVTKARLVYNVQDIFPDNLFQLTKTGKYKYFIFALLNSILYKKVDHMIAISDDMKNYLIERKVKDEKISVVYNWPHLNVNDNRKHKINIKQKLGIVNKIMILYAGNLGKFQNPSILLDVIDKLDDNYVLVVMGDGSEKKELINKVKEKKIENVIFAESQPLEFMPTIYGQADINFISFHPGIYKTALPSKLPFCLTTDKPIIFTVEENSLIAKMLSDDMLTQCINAHKIDEIVTKIKAFNQVSNVLNNQKRLIIVDQYFSNTKNPLEYKKIILNNQR